MLTNREGIMEATRVSGRTATDTSAFLVLYVVAIFVTLLPSEKFASKAQNGEKKKSSAIFYHVTIKKRMRREDRPIKTETPSVRVTAEMIHG